jgi:hypothetical protein
MMHGESVQVVLGRSTASSTGPAPVAGRKKARRSMTAKTVGTGKSLRGYAQFKVTKTRRVELSD